MTEVSGLFYIAQVTPRGVVETAQTLQSRAAGRLAQLIGRNVDIKSLPPDGWMATNLGKNEEAALVQRTLGAPPGAVLGDRAVITGGAYERLFAGLDALEEQYPLGAFNPNRGTFSRVDDEGYAAARAVLEHQFADKAVRVGQRLNVTIEQHPVRENDVLIRGLDIQG